MKKLALRKQSLIHALIILALLCLVLLFTPTAGADLEGDLDNFLDELGGAASTTTPSSFEGQGYLYLNGGQAFVRVPTR